MGVRAPRGVSVGVHFGVRRRIQSAYIAVPAVPEQVLTDMGVCAAEVNIPMLCSRHLNRRMTPRWRGLVPK